MQQTILKSYLDMFKYIWNDDNTRLSTNNNYYRNNKNIQNEYEYELR